MKNKNSQHSGRARMEQKSDALYRLAAFRYDESLENVMEKNVYHCMPHDSIRDVAEEMARRKISSVIVTDEHLKPLGIVTERDIVRNVVAGSGERRDEREIRTIMTPDPVCLPPDGTLFDALSLIYRYAIKHLPIVNENKVAGIVTLRQIMKIRYAEPFLILGQLQEAASVKDFRTIRDEMIYLVKEKMEANTDPADIVTMLSLVNAGIHKRLLAKTIDQYGAPPDIDYCFFVTGSHGRKENLLFPDQDYCVIMDDFDDRHHRQYDTYFLEISRRLSDQLNEVGFPYCPGKIMGHNPAWRKRMSEWFSHLSKIISGQEEYTVRYMTLIFDSSFLYGSADLFQKYQDHAFDTLAQHHNVLRQMHDEEEGRHKVPLGLFNTFITDKAKGHRGEIDMKKSGLIFMIESARILALKHAIRETSTLNRIRALVGKGIIKRDDSEYFENAYRVILYHTLRAQVDNYLTKGTNDYYLSPHQLSHRNQEVLKEAFKAVSTLQDIVGLEFGEM